MLYIVAFVAGAVASTVINKMAKPVTHLLSFTLCMKMLYHLRWVFAKPLRFIFSLGHRLVKA